MILSLSPCSLSHFLFRLPVPSSNLRASLACAIYLAFLDYSVLCGRLGQQIRHPRRHRTPWRSSLGCLHLNRPCLCAACIPWSVFVPSQALKAFGSLFLIATGCNVPSVFSSGLLPAFIGRGFLTTTDSSATLHHIFSPLCFHLFELTCFPRMMQGFPGKVCLPELEPIRPNSPGYLAFGLSHFLQGYPPDEPTSVSLALCSKFPRRLPPDLTVTSVALAYRLSSR